MGRIITSPEALQPQCNRSVFLAGGISDCWDWQSKVAETLAEQTDALIYNPRRQDFNMDAYEDTSRDQINWEWHALRLSTVNLFWFPAETLCPITLLEYGSAMERLPTGGLMVGTHINYARRFDVIEQTRLKNHGYVWSDLDSLVLETCILLNSIPA